MGERARRREMCTDADCGAGLLLESAFEPRLWRARKATPFRMASAAEELRSSGFSALLAPAVVLRMAEGGKLLSPWFWGQSFPGITYATPCFLNRAESVIHAY